MRRLVERGFASDPVETWKESLKRPTIDDDTRCGASSTSSAGHGPNFGYLLNMPLVESVKGEEGGIVKTKG